jgi:hypothetical protein
LQVAGSTYVNGGTLFIDSGEYLRWGNSTQGIRGVNDTSLEFIVGSSERMRITAAGKVGIGNTNPGDFSGDANTLVLGSTGTSLAGMTIATTTAGAGSIYFADGTDGTSTEYRGFIQYDHSGDGLSLGAAGASRLYMTSTVADFTTSIKTGAPSGGTAATWKLGSRITNSCGLPSTYANFVDQFMNTNKVIEVEIGGVTVYIPTVTPGWC